jgi:serine protease Do
MPMLTGRSRCAVVLLVTAASALKGVPAQAQATAPAAPVTDPDPRIGQLRDQVRELVGSARDKVFPALVNIEVVTLQYDGGKETKDRSTGSGTIVTPDGFVLTNAHVTDDGYRFFVTLADKQRVPATLVGEDPWTDLAVLKIDTAKLLKPDAPLPFASFGNSDELRVGDYVLAMGSPFSLSRTVTLGIVSNTERVFTSARDGEADEMLLNWEQRTGLFTNWIQHDALINPGNSGGPLVNLQGQVIGVNTRGGSGMAFASPSSLAQRVYESLRATGDVPRSSIGATFRHTQNTGIEQGVLVDSVDNQGPAFAAGLRAGDVITTINASPLNVRFVEEIPPLLKQIAEIRVGETLTLGYQRGGKAAEAVITTERLLRDRGEEAALRVWGITIQRITDRMAKLRRLPSTKGAMLSSIRGGSPAATAEPALQWGDVVTSIDSQPIATINDLVEAYKRIEAMTEKPEYVLVGFERENKSLLTLVEPKAKDRPDPTRDLPKAWIGVATQPIIRNLAEKLATGEKKWQEIAGFRVTRVYSNTKAEKAGLKVGDIITSIGGKRVAPRTLAEAGQFSRAVKELQIDADAPVAVLRDGQSVELTITMEGERLTPELAKREQDRDFELDVRELTFFDREDNRWGEDIKGMFVNTADPSGWAGMGGISGGDLIQRVGDSEITDRESFRAAIKAIKASQPERVVFVIFRGNRTFFRFVEPDWKPTQRPARLQPVP